jgi:hypothetical protein
MYPPLKEKIIRIKNLDLKAEIIFEIKTPNLIT